MAEMVDRLVEEVRGRINELWSKGRDERDNRDSTEGTPSATKNTLELDVGFQDTRHHHTCETIGNDDTTHTTTAMTTTRFPDNLLDIFSKHDFSDRRGMRKIGGAGGVHFVDAYLLMFPTPPPPFVPAEPETVPSVYTGTHLTILQGMDQIWHMEHKTFRHINFPVTVCERCPPSRPFLNSLTPYSH